MADVDSASGQKTSVKPDQDRLAPRLRAGHVLSGLFLFLAAISLAYIGGVMLGRHSGTAREAKPAGVDMPAVAVEQPADDDRRILAPEDLRFARVLRNLPAPPAPRQAHPEESGAEAGGAGPAPAQPAADAASGPGDVIQQSAPPAPDMGVMSDYVFQVGAFRDENSVDALRQRLEGRGLRTRMQREGRLYIVLVLLRGNEQRAGEVQAIVEEMRLGKPILRSRKPVGLN